MTQHEIIALAEYSRIRGFFAFSGPILIIAFRIAINISVILATGDYVDSNEKPDVDIFKLTMLVIGIIWWYWVFWGGIYRSLFGPKTAVYIMDGEFFVLHDFAISTNMIDKILSRSSLRGPYVDIHYEKNKIFSINCVLFRKISEEFIRNIEKYWPKIDRE